MSSELPPDPSPLATVYIVNRNYGRFLRQAIDSALTQTYLRLEIVVVDDASEDDSDALLTSLSEESRIHIIRHTSVRGLTACCNSAIQASEGEFVMRLDADDYLKPRAVEAMVKALQASPSAVLVACNHVEVSHRGDTIRLSRPQDRCNGDIRSDIPPHGACMMVRKSFLEHMGGYDEAIPYQDGLDLWLHLDPQHHALYLSEPLVCYRQHGSNLTRDTGALVQARSRIFTKHIARRRLGRPRVLAVVALDPVHTAVDGPLRNLGEKPLIEWTLDEALHCPGVDRLVVSSSNVEVLQHVFDRYGTSIEVHNPTDAGLSPIAEVERSSGQRFDAVLFLNWESPFRSCELMQQAIHVMQLFDSNEVLGVQREEGIFHRHNGIGLVPTLTDDFYRVCPGLKLANLKQTGDQELDSMPASSRVGHVLFDQIAAFTIRTALDWELAERISQSFSREFGNAF